MSPPLPRACERWDEWARRYVDPLLAPHTEAFKFSRRRARPPPRRSIAAGAAAAPPLTHWVAYTGSGANTPREHADWWRFVHGPRALVRIARPGWCAGASLVWRGRDGPLRRGAWLRVPATFVPLSAAQVDALERAWRANYNYTLDDGRVAALVGPAALMEHCCAPALELRERTAHAMCFEALRDVAAGEPLSYSYGPHYFATNDPGREPCANPACCGDIGDAALRVAQRLNAPAPHVRLALRRAACCEREAVDMDQQGLQANFADNGAREVQIAVERWLQRVCATCGGPRPLTVTRAPRRLLVVHCNISNNVTPRFRDGVEVNGVRYAPAVLVTRSGALLVRDAAAARRWTDARRQPRAPPSDAERQSVVAVVFARTLH